LTITCVSAQDNKDRAKMMEDLQNFKIDFLAKEMQLTEKEKAEFIPLYKDYDKECRQSGSEVWKLERELKRNKNASDADYKKLAELQQKSREKHNEIVKRFDARLETFLSAKHIYNMHQGEERFLDKMKEMRRKNHDGKHPHARPDAKPGDKRHRDMKDGMHSDGTNPPEPNE
ncbi:MAG: hypothetical protein K2O47_08300, partial [Muribaculaceae bacterium]|nr:hypothetical protein [Muribaculaceae bacterium]